MSLAGTTLPLFSESHFTTRRVLRSKSGAVDIYASQLSETRMRDLEYPGTPSAFGFEGNVRVSKRPSAIEKLFQQIAETPVEGANTV